MERMESTLTHLATITEKTKSLVTISYIDPSESKEFSLYKRDQEKLSGEARRHQSTVSRYAAEKKKEKTDDQAQDNLKQENDRLKQELAKAKGEQLGNFRELFKEMTQADKAEANKNKNKNKNNEGDWQEKGRKKGGSGAGKGGKGRSGKGGKGGGKGGGRKKGRGK